LPSTVPSGRYHNDFPRHAAEQVRAIIGLLECQRSLRYVAIGLFLLGHQVRKTTLRTAFGALAQGTSKQIGSQSKSRDPSEQADAATEALMRMIRRKRLLTAVRQQLGHEGAPAPDRIVRRALKSFFLVFLNGKTMLGVAEAGLRDLVNAVPIVPGVPPAVVDAIKRQAGSHRLSIGGALAGTPLESALSYAFLAERLSLNKLQQTAPSAQRDHRPLRPRPCPLAQRRRRPRRPPSRPFHPLDSQRRDRPPRAGSRPVRRDRKGTDNAAMR